MADDPTILKSIILLLLWLGFGYGMWRWGRFWERRKAEGKTDTEILQASKTAIVDEWQQWQQRYIAAVTAAKVAKAEMDKLKSLSPPPPGGAP